MFKINDRMLLGMVSGILAALPIKYLMQRQRALKLMDRHYSELSAQVFLPKGAIKTRKAHRLGNAINNFGVGATGIFLAYLMSLSGTERAFVKGMAVGSVGWVIVDGYLAGQILKRPYTKPLGPALGLVNHALFGGLTALLVTKLGNEDLFPDKNMKGLKGQHLSDQSYREVELPVTLRR